MKIVILAPVLALAALSVSGCGPKADTGATNAAAPETLTLNEEGDAALANSDAFEANATDPAPDNTIADNALAPVAGNAL